MVKKLLLSVFTISMAAMPFQYSNAQSSDPGPQAEVIRNSINLLPQNGFSVTFFNNPSESVSSFTMRLIVPGSVAGCAKIKEPFLSKEQKNKYKDLVGGVQTTYASGTLRVSMLRPELALDPEVNAFSGTTRYSPYDCDIRHNSAQVDLKLDRDELIKNSVKKMSFEVVKFMQEDDFGQYDVDVTEENITFKSRTMDGIKWITHWFFPKNTVILYAPQAKQGQNVHDMITELAASQGLSPIENTFKNYMYPVDALHYAIFTDPSQQIIKRINALDEQVAVGNIKPTRTRFTASGETVETYDLPVYAMKPGQFK